MKYRITDITNFATASSCSTIVQAAERLEISQPALSESIKRLESDLGAILLYRSRSGIQLTPSGKVFLSKAHELMRVLANLDVSNHVENIFGGRTITVGCHPIVAQYSIPKALKHIKAHAPDYRIDLKHDLSRNIQAEIQRGNIDIGIVINPTRVPDLVIQKMAVDIVGVWSTKEDFDTVICNPNLFQTQYILKRWRNKPPKILSTDSLELICRLVSEDIGCGIIPERAVKLSGFDLKKLSNLASFKDEICLVYRPEFGKAPAEKMMIEALKKAINID